MFHKDAHALSHITKSCSTKVKFKWTDLERSTFMATKKIVGRYILPSYPNLSEEFIIDIDARNKNLRGVMIQNGQTFTFYSVKSAPEKLVIQLQK